MTAYLPTVTKQLEIPGSRAAQRQITCTLRLYASTTGEAFGYATGGSHVNVGGVQIKNPDASGLVTFTGVRPNSGTSTTVITSPTGTVYQLVTVYPGRPAITEYISVPDGAGPYNAEDILSTAPGSLAVAGSPSSAQARLSWAADWENYLTGTITYNANGAPTSGTFSWPDGTTGTWTGTPSTTFVREIDSYTITYGSTTYTQPTVTRNSAGAITTKPAITVS